MTGFAAAEVLWVSDTTIKRTVAAEDSASGIKENQEKQGYGGDCKFCCVVD